MRKGLGENLNPDLSIRENMAPSAADLGDRAEREWRIANLLDSTGLAERPAKKNRGGMRQKLRLCHPPDGGKSDGRLAA
jgi:ABC-type multidrug transport system ATPase subunit